MRERKKKQKKFLRPPSPTVAARPQPGPVPLSAEPRSRAASCPVRAHHRGGYTLPSRQLIASKGGPFVDAPDRVQRARCGVISLDYLVLTCITRPPRWRKVLAQSPDGEKKKIMGPHCAVPEHVRIVPRRQAALEKNSPVRVGGGSTMRRVHSNVTPRHFVTIVCVCGFCCVDVSMCACLVCFVCAPDLEGGARSAGDSGGKADSTTDCRLIPATLWRCSTPWAGTCILHRSALSAFRADSLVCLPGQGTGKRGAPWLRR